MNNHHHHHPHYRRHHHHHPPSTRQDRRSSSGGGYDSPRGGAQPMRRPLFHSITSHRSPYEFRDGEIGGNSWHSSGSRSNGGVEDASLAASDSKAMVTGSPGPLFLQYRFRVCLLMMFCIFCSGAMRAKLGMAMVCMVNSTAVHHLAVAAKENPTAGEEETWETKLAKGEWGKNYSSDKILEEAATTSPALKPLIASPSGSFSSSRKLCPNEVPENNAETGGSSSGGGEGGGYHGTFLWSEREQGQVFSAFFYGALLSMWWSGYVADHVVGPKRLLLGAIAIESCICMLCPLLANWSLYAFMVGRFLMGITEGVLYPSVTSAAARWFPPMERSTMVAIYTMGNQLADISAISVSSRLCALEQVLGGWPLIFLTFGILGLFSCVLWSLFFTDNPSENRWISAEEQAYLRSATTHLQATPNHHPHNNADKNNNGDGNPMSNIAPNANGNAMESNIDTAAAVALMPANEGGDADGVVAEAAAPKRTGGKLSSVPWRRLATSRALYAAVLANIVFIFTIILVQSYLPTYVKEVLRLNLKQNGLFSAVPFVTILVTKLATGRLSDTLKSGGLLSSTAAARLFQSVASFGVGAALLLLANLVDCTRPMLALAILFFYGLCFASAVCGFFTALLSMSPPHTGILISLSLTIATSGSIGAPTLVGLIHKEGTAEEWRLIWSIAAMMNIVAGLVFLLFGSAEEQNWSATAIPTTSDYEPDWVGKGEEEEGEDGLGAIIATTRSRTTIASRKRSTVTVDRACEYL